MLFAEPWNSAHLALGPRRGSWPHDPDHTSPLRRLARHRGAHPPPPGARVLLGAGIHRRAGRPRRLVVVPARTAAEAVVTRPVRELVLKDGEVVARDGRIV